MTALLPITFQIANVAAQRACLARCLRNMGLVAPCVPNGSLVRLRVKVPQNQATYLRLIGCLVEVNRIDLDMWPFPLLYSGHVRYEAEQGEVFQDLASLAVTGKGDCEDLVAARVAELRSQGIKAMPHLDQSGSTPSGGRLFHVVVKLPTGRTEDPSAKLGM